MRIPTAGGLVVTDELAVTERQKYETVWGDYPEYRTQADGDPVVELAFRAMGCCDGDTLIDWGCGKGTPAAKFQKLGLQVIGLDIAKNCLDADVKIPLVVGTLWDPPWLPASDYAFCTDVLEHLPPEKLDRALLNMANNTKRAAFIQVCTVLDTSGPKMTPPQRLHLSVHPPSWWEAKLSTYWIVTRSERRGKSRSWFLCRHGEK